MELNAPADWQAVDFISDLHLQSTLPLTFQAWRSYLQRTRANAVFILGDLFDVWIGDDVANDPHSWEARCGEVLRQAAASRPIFFMPGNRDFLLGPSFGSRYGVALLPDPTTLVFAQERTLLTHGDAWCLDDHPYQAFRTQVRNSAWQVDFLAKPLSQRQVIAQDLRKQSASAQSARGNQWIDLHEAAIASQMLVHSASRLIHGHTHRPCDHSMPGGWMRHVLTDWDLESTPARGHVLRIALQDRAPSDVQRLPLNSPAL